MVNRTEGHSIDALNNRIIAIIKGAAEKCIPKGKGIRKSKIVPWWNEECNEAIRNKRKAFRKLKRTHNFQNLVKYKVTQVLLRRVVRKTKREYWRSFCNELAVTDEEKAKMFRDEFIKVNSSRNLCEERKKIRE